MHTICSLLLLLSFIAVSRAEAENGLYGLWQTGSSSKSAVECANVSSNLVKLDVVLYSSSGVLLKTHSIEIPARGAVQIPVEYVPSQKYGWYELNSSNSVFCQAVGLTFNGDASSNDIHSGVLIPAFTSGSSHQNYLVRGLPGAQQGALWLLNTENHEKKVRVSSSAVGSAEQSVLIPARGLKQIDIPSLTDWTSLVVQSESPIRTLLTVQSTERELSLTAINASTPTCASGPLPVSTLGKATVELAIANSEDADQPVNLEYRTAAGELIVNEEIVVKANTRFSRVVDQSQHSGRIAYVEYTCIGGGPQRALFGSVTSYQSSPTGTAWVYYVSGAENLATSDDLGALIVNTRMSALNHARIIEADTILSECLLNIYEQSGTLFTQNNITVPPQCAFAMKLEPQMGADFFGVAITRSASRAGKYRAEIRRILLSADKTSLRALLRAPAHIFKPERLEEIVVEQDPELLFCPSNDTLTAPTPTPIAKNNGLVLTAAEMEKRQARVVDLARRAHELQKLGKWDEALKLFEEAIALYPKFVCGRENRAAILWRLHRESEAIDEYQIILSLDPDNIRARDALGNLLSTMKKDEMARSVIEEAIKLDPTSPVPLCSLGRLEIRASHLDSAETAFKKALALEADIPCGIDGLSLVEKSRGNIVSMIAYQDRLLKIYDEVQERRLHLGPETSRAWLYGRVADIFYQRKKYRMAHELAVSSMTLDPAIEGVNQIAGIAALENGNIELAKKYLQEDVERNSTNGLSLMNMGYLSFRTQDYTAAQSYYDRAMTVMPNSAQLLVNRGELAQAMGDYGLAVEEFKNALDAEPTNPVGIISLGWHLFQQGHLEQARAVLENGKQSFPQNVQLLINLGLSYQRMGLNQEAGKEFELVTQIDPSNYWGWHNLAGTTYLLGDKERAFTLSSKAMALGKKEHTLKTFYCTLVRELQKQSSSECS